MDDIAGIQNFLRLRILLNYGTRSLQNIFKSRYEQFTGTKWTDSDEDRTKFTNNIGRGYYQQAQKIQRKILEDGNLQEWDLSMLSQVLTTKSSLSHSNKNDDDEIKTKLNQENSAIKQLIEVRNKYSHLSNEFLSSNDFIKLWNLATSSLTQLGGCAEEFESLRTAENIGNIQFKNDHPSQDCGQDDSTALTLREAGNTAVGSNNFEQAIRLYTEALSLRISRVERGILLSNRSYAYLKTLDSVHCNEEIQSTCDLALEDCRSAINLRPEWWKGYYRQGQIYQRLKEWSAAVMSYNQSLGLDPSQDKVKKCRDECRVDWRLQETEQHLDPYSMPSSLAEDLEKQKIERGVNLDPDDLVKKHEECMKSKDPEVVARGCVFFGHRHWQGVDATPVDHGKAASYFARAARSGNAEGMYKLGVLYQLGQGVKRDLGMAIKFFEEAADQPVNDKHGMKNVGVAFAQYAMGKCYHEGTGTTIDFYKAAKWYEKASANGSALAANNLGVLYSQGQGVEQSQETATQYFKLAATRGMTTAMDTLAWRYLMEGDLKEAQIWFQRAIDSGNLKSLVNQRKFYEAVANQLSTLQEYQDKFGLEETCTNLKDVRQVITQVTNEKFPQVQEVMESVQKKSAESQSPSSSNTLENKYFKNYEAIKDKASQGHQFAQQLVDSMAHFHNGLVALNEYDFENKQVNLTQEIIHQFANCIKIQEIVITLTSSLQDKLKEIVNQVFIDNDEDLDQDARICYIYLNSNSFEEVLEFIKMSKLKYPLESFFPFTHSNILAYQLKYKEGAQVAQEALELFPNHQELLYCKAGLEHFGWDQNTQNIPAIKQAYLQFLEFAPQDHRHVPESYYSLADLTSREMEGGKTKNEVKEETLKFYNKGIEAENIFCPCFLPYESTTKMMLQMAMDIAPDVDQKQLTKEHYAKYARSPPFMSQKKDHGMKIELKSPQRMEIAVTHRSNWVKEIETIANLNARGNGTTTVTTMVTLPIVPLHEQKASNDLENLENITLKEMDPFNDRVYNGRIIKLTIMEDSRFGIYESVPTVVRDEDGTFQFCYFGGVDQNDKEIKRKLSFGSILSVQNPYHRLCADGTNGLRVDDPKSIIFHSDGNQESKCRFCAKSNAKLTCSKCKRAKYCDKDCQFADWKFLKHKLICDIKFSQFV